jgi:hypothetical protein
MHSTPIASPDDVLVRDFCLATRNHLVLASIRQITPDQDAPSDVPAVAIVPCVLRMTLHLVHTETGEERDRYVLTDDYVALDGHSGVHMHGDLLCVLSIRRQTLHVLHINDSIGRLMCVARIGTHCNPDDEMQIAGCRDAELRAELLRHTCNPAPRIADGNAHMETEAEFGMATTRHSGETRSTITDQHDERSVRLSGVRHGISGYPLRTLPMLPAQPQANSEVSSDHSLGNAASARVRETGLGGGKSPRGFFTGLMQRLLVYVFHQHRLERNLRFFFRVVGQYSMLVMLKAQLLDDNHLLIRLGSLEREGTTPDPAKNTCFFVVYCISTTHIVSLYENRSPELVELYETHRDLFIADPAVSATLPPVRPSPRGPMPTLRTDALTRRPMYGGTAALISDVSASVAETGMTPSHRRARGILAGLPVSSQSRNVSVYLDRRLFSYTDDRNSALDGSRAISMRELQAIKFIATGGGLRFKLTPGIPGGDGVSDPGTGGSSSGRRKTLFLFHPVYPFVISMQTSSNAPMHINFHVRDDTRQL